MAIAAVLLGLWAARREKTVSFPEQMAMHGIDVSHHNGTIEWPRVADAGISFAWIKASEGGDVVDDAFTTNVIAARDAGLSVGAYHFFTFCRPGADQAQNFLTRVEAMTFELPPAIDVELVGNCKTPPAPEVVRAEIEAWLALVEKKLERTAVLYTTPDVNEFLLHGLDRPRWIRSIGEEPKGEFLFWQFTDEGRVAGIEGPVDLDVAVMR